MKLKLVKLGKIYTPQRSFIFSNFFDFIMALELKNKTK